MEHNFEFGSNVTHQQFGKGVVIGTDKLVRVYFEAGVIIGFYQARVVNEDRLVSELSQVSDWVKIDWNDESTLPPSGKKVLVLVSERIEIDSYKCPFAFFQHGFEINGCYATHWQPLPQPPKDK